jgi:glycosyltransferase 2 family protein
MSQLPSLPTIWQQFTHRMEDKRLQRWLFFLILLLSGAFIAVALITNWGQLRPQLQHIHYSYILLAVFLYPLGMLPTIAAWHTLLNAFGVSRSFTVNLRLYCLSSLQRHIPGFVMFVASRSYVYEQIGIPAALSATITIAETILLASTGLIISLILVPFGMGKFFQEHSLTLLLLFVGFLLILLINGTSLFNKLVHKICQRFKIQNIPELEQKYLTRSLVWMCLAWAGGGIILYTLIQAAMPMDISRLPILIGVWGLAGGVSMTIGLGFQGMGIREITMSAVLTMFMPMALAVTVAVVFRLVTTIGEVLWVLIFIGLTHRQVLVNPTHQRNDSNSDGE